jgi:hypothetical protein
MRRVLGIGNLQNVDVPGAVDVLTNYLLDLGDLDEAAPQERPSIARFEALLSEAAGGDAVVSVDSTADGVFIVINAENGRRLETVVLLLSAVSRGHLTVVDGERVRRYVMRGTPFVREGRLAWSGAMRPMAAW